MSRAAPRTPAWLKGLVAQLPDIVYECDAAGRWTFLNAAWAHLTGRAVDVALGSRAVDAVAPCDRRAAAALFAALRSGEAGEGPHKLRFLRSDGTTGWASVSAVPVRRGGRRFAGVRGTIRDVTARKEAEAALAAKEQLYRLLADNSNDMIVRIGANGVRRYVSPASLAVLGYAPEELIGATPVAAIHPKDRARVVEVCESLLKGAHDPICTYRQRHRNGHYVWLEATYRLVRGDDGAPEFIASVRDVSRRLQAEVDAAESAAALDDNARLLHLAGTVAQIGHWRVDAVTNTLTWSPLVYAIHGVPEDRPITRAAAIALHHPDDRTKMSTLVARAIERAEPFEVEGRVIRPDGELRHIAARGIPQFAPNGDVVGVFGVAQDVTDRVAAEAAKHAQDGLFRMITEQTTDALLRLDLDGRCLYASPSVRRVIGADPAAMVDQIVLTRFHPEDRDQVLATYRTLASGMQNRVTFTYRARRVDVTDIWIWLEANCALVRDANGAPAEVIASLRDVTARKALEFELAAERDRAETAAAAKAQFLAHMSHEIRTPMNGVIGFTELLLEDELTDEQRVRAQLILDSSRAMMHLLNDILDMSKIEAGRMEVRRQPVVLADLLGACLQMVEPLANSKRLALSLDVSEAVPGTILADPVRLRQVVLNLLGNAVKFTHTGTVALRAEMIDADAALGGAIAIRVADTGIGIAASDRDTIFAPFGQVMQAQAATPGGTGLGLPISRQLAALMGGSLTVESRPGVGSVFTLSLPHLVPTPARPAPAPVRVAAGPMPDCPDLRVLVAEDHPVSRLLVKARLERFGVTVDVVEDGAAAVAQVLAATDACPYDLLLLDMQMPVLGGIEAARQIRAAGIGPADLPIVALTANAYPEDVAACRAAGMQMHVAKPVSQDDLAAALSLVTRDAETRPRGEPPAATFSAARLDEMLGTFGAAGAGELIDCLLADLATRPATLATAAEHGDGDGLARAAHTLRGSICCVGAQDLERRLLAIEDAATRGAPVDADQIARIGTAAQALRDAIAAWRQDAIGPAPARTGARAG